MNNQPLISIGIPTRNRINYLKEAVKSILDQTYQNIEIIISNNASIDNTKEWLDSLNSLKVKVIHQSEDIGMVSNWNICVAASTGNFFLLLSDDDYLDTNFLFEMVSVTNTGENPNSLIFGNLVVVSDFDKKTSTGNNRRRLGKKYFEDVLPTNFVINFLLGNMEIYPCCILFNVNDLKKINNFPKSYNLASDASAWIRILINSNINEVPFAENAISYYRKHDSSATISTKKSLWAHELLLLTSEFISLTREKFIILPSKINTVLFRAKCRGSFYERKNVFEFFNNVIFHFIETKPPLIEFFLAIVRWSLNEKIWNSIKRTLKL
jgi:glycosyltransferase involved in cell wall biosynthesis